MGEIKRYRLNKDFSIECETDVLEDGKSYSVRVVMYSLVFEPVIEEVTGITNSSEANGEFKRLAEKYKEGINI